MTDDPEPDVNISGGAAGGGRPIGDEDDPGADGEGPGADGGSGDPDTRAAAVVDRLGDLYWQ